MNKLLRDYQRKMLESLEMAWVDHRSVMVQMPTGTGKTVLMAEVIRQEMGNEELGMMNGNSKGILIVAHRRELIEQIRQTLRVFGLSQEWVRVESIQKLYSHFGDSPRVIRDATHTGDSPRWEPQLVIVDEAHHAVAKTYRMLWERWPEAKFLGLTATPCRLSGEPFTDLFDVLVQSWSVSEFIRKGWLSDLDYISVKSDSSDFKKVAGLDKRGLDGDYQTKQTALVLDTEESIAHLYQSYKHFADGKKGIVYAINREHALHIAAYYQERAVRCAVIDSNTPAKERLQTVEKYRQQELDVLVNCEIFTEGFDVPEVEFIQLARPTMSLALYLQQVGRGMRVSKGKDKVIVLDQVGLYLSMGLPTKERDWQGMFLGRVKGQGVPLSSYILSDVEEAVNKMLMNVEMVRLTDYERMKDELQQQWEQELKQQQREQERKARREALRKARAEELAKVNWYGSLGIFREKGRYGIRRKDGECLPATYEQIIVRKSKADRYFGIARLPVEVSGNSRLWTVITVDGEDLQMRMKGDYVRREDDVFEFRTEEDGRFVACLYDVKFRKSYTNARMDMVGGIRCFYIYHEDGYVLRGDTEDGKLFKRSDVVYNSYLAIIGDELMVKSGDLKRYKITGYREDKVIVKDDSRLVEMGKDGVKGKTLRRMPRNMTKQPDFLMLGLQRETAMSSVNDIETGQWRVDYRQKMLEPFFTRGSKSVLLQTSIGTGRMWMLMPFIKEYLESRTRGKTQEKNVLIVTPRKERAFQIRETLKKYNIYPRIMGLNDMAGWCDKNAAIMTTEFAQSHPSRVDRLLQPTLIIYEDAHLIPNDVYAMLRQKWPKARRIGMTATPAGINGLVLNTVFTQYVGSPSLRELVRKGWMKDINYVDIGIDQRKKEKLESLEGTDEAGDYIASDTTRMMDTSEEVERLYQAYLKHAEGKRGIVCAISPKHAKHIEECYNRHGVKAAIGLDPETMEGRQQMENLRNGILKVVVVIRYFSDEIRCPDVDFVQLACPTRILSTYLQQVECGMWKDWRSVDHSVMVLDHVGAKEKFGLPTDERDWKKLFEEEKQEGVVKKRTRKVVAEKKEEPVVANHAAAKWQMRMQRLLGGGESERAVKEEMKEETGM